MRLNPWRARARQIERLRGTLERDHYPRAQMGLIVALTGFAGLAASFLMLQAGLTSMALRYCYAMGAAYIVFIVLLWLWLRWNADGLDLPSGDGGGGDPVSAFSGKGGTFDGGGASGDYEPASQAFDAGSGSGDGFGADVDVGDAAIALAVVALVIGVALSSLFVIYTAPVLFAELLVDGLLSASLYRSLRGVDRRHWLDSALRRTCVPFLLTAAFVTAAGWGMGVYAPEAVSIGEVLRHRAQAAAPR